MSNYNLSHLKQLEAEAIYVIREAAAQFNNPALLFSGGKDSVVMAHLAYKAFYPARMPFPLVTSILVIILPSAFVSVMPLWKNTKLVWWWGVCRSR